MTFDEICLAGAPAVRDEFVAFVQRQPADAAPDWEGFRQYLQAEHDHDPGEAPSDLAAAYQAARSR